jgi:ribosomal-protein-alanine N-acetyltransferase
MSSITSPQEQFFARSMRFSDVDLVVANETSAYKYPWSKQNFLDCLQSGYQCWVLADKQQIIAHGVISIAICESHLLTLCVHPKYQRRGFGRKILILLLDRAAQLESAECFLEVRISNRIAISLYESLGFGSVGRRKGYYPSEQGREDALIMSRTLPIP